MNGERGWHQIAIPFNVQLYHYGERVRLGESSGSLHASAGIPVIFEMNGAERIEEIEAIKVPYADPERVDSADLKSAAIRIVDMVDSGEYLNVLTYNRRMASIWNYQTVARLYIEFLESIESW